MKRLLDRMDRIEKNFDHIWVRQGFVSKPLSEVSAHQCMTWIFKWLREAINEPSDNEASSASGNRG